MGSRMVCEGFGCGAGGFYGSGLGAGLRGFGAMLMEARDFCIDLAGATFITERSEVPMGLGLAGFGLVNWAFSREVRSRFRKLRSN